MGLPALRYLRPEYLVGSLGNLKRETRAAAAPTAGNQRTRRWAFCLSVRRAERKIIQRRAV